MPTFVIGRGLPGSGKTTRARAVVAQDPDSWVRLNRDDFRVMGHGRRTGRRSQEDQVTVVQHAGIRAALTAGYNVVVDDVNLNPAVFQELVRIGVDCGARVDVGTLDLRGVPLGVCHANNQLRFGTDQFVPPEEIERMHATYLAKDTDA
jgi:predicted kinase